LPRKGKQLKKSSFKKPKELKLRFLASNISHGVKIGPARGEGRGSLIFLVFI
jgi:hypothetical protein